MKVRAGELKKTWFRSERFFHADNGWFFVTRENTQEGPFSSQPEAEKELMLYIRHLNEDLYPSVNH
ncbi:MAG: hypothetical protein HWE13_14260 [Gammaproteobacteria bacterium]|nr:hypothetical protein [Gammaproteobacteria bacterium]NVK89296.1 hypothetical protein [Gammaproteobacteria bacterium]